MRPDASSAQRHRGNVHKLEDHDKRDGEGQVRSFGELSSLEGTSRTHAESGKDQTRYVLIGHWRALSNAPRRSGNHQCVEDHDRHDENNSSEGSNELADREGHANKATVAPREMAMPALKSKVKRC